MALLARPVSILPISIPYKIVAYSLTFRTISDWKSSIPRYARVESTYPESIQLIDAIIRSFLFIVLFVIKNPRFRSFY